MNEEQIQQLNNRMGELETLFKKNIFSNREIFPAFADFQGQLKIPNFATTPASSAGEVGQIRSINGVLYICSAVDTWTPLLTSLSKFTQSFTADEDIATNVPVKIGIYGLNYFSNTTQGNLGDHSLRLDGTNPVAIANAFTVPAGGGGVSNVRLRIAKEGTPSQSVVVAIQADSAGSPSGTDLATSSIAGSTITTSYADYNFSFTLSGLAAGSYWVVVRVSAAANVFDIDCPGAGSNSKSYFGSWSACATMNVTVTLNEVSVEGRIKKALAVTGYQSYGFIGFTSAAISSGVAGNVATTGILTGFTSLTPGATYYLQNNGTIGTSAGTVSIKVGVALTSTILLINIPPQ